MYPLSHTPAAAHSPSKPLLQCHPQRVAEGVEILAAEERLHSPRRCGRIAPGTLRDDAASPSPELLGIPMTRQHSYRSDAGHSRAQCQSEINKFRSIEFSLYW